MPAFIGYQNRILTATLSASSQAANLPVTNLQTPHADVTNQWRTTSRAGNVIADTGSSASTWRLFMLAALNANANILMRVVISDNADMSAPNYDSNWQGGIMAPGYQQLVWITSSEVQGRYCQILLNNGSNPDPYLSVGLAYAGPAYVPSRGLSYESSWIASPTQDVVETRGGQEYITQRFRRRAWDIAFGSLPAADVYASVAEVMRVADLGVNIAFVPFSDGDPSREAIMGRLRTTSGIGYPARVAQYRSWRAQITERL